MFLSTTGRKTEKVAKPKTFFEIVLQAILASFEAIVELKGALDRARGEVSESIVRILLAFSYPDLCLRYMVRG